MNENLDPTVLDVRDLIQHSHLPKQWTMLFAPENRKFLLDYSTCDGWYFCNTADFRYTELYNQPVN